MESVLLIGSMAIYNSQAEASERIPQQWREFRRRHPSSATAAIFVAIICDPPDSFGDIWELLVRNSPPRLLLDWVPDCSLAA
jgi:hypothetical protein